MPVPITTAIRNGAALQTAVNLRSLALCFRLNKRHMYLLEALRTRLASNSELLIYNIILLPVQLSPLYLQF